MKELEKLGHLSKQAAAFLGRCTTEEKNTALRQIAKALQAAETEILAANQTDLRLAKENGMAPSMQDRLMLNAPRLGAVIDAIEKIVSLKDPVGTILEEKTLPNGLAIQKVRVPLGVVGIIYEARPNVTVDSAVLCLKSGNASFLRGGKETIHTNIALEKAMRTGLKNACFPEAAITLLHDTDREAAAKMMRMRGFLDVLIPRGGAGLIQAVTENATVPVIETGTGNCHIYVDKDADLAIAQDILLNAKTQRVSVCNAAETLLVHRDVARDFLPMAQKALSAKNVQLRCCEHARSILPQSVLATESDWEKEFLDYILAIKVVDSLDEALAHIARYSTHHSESIITANQAVADRFLQEIDSAVVYHNTSTRFTDGEEFGLGAEIGISTQKLHARGPMGLSGLCSYKYLVRSDGKIRE